MGFLVDVIDTRVNKKESIMDVPIVHEFPNVFHEDFPGVPPER